MVLGILCFLTGLCCFVKEIQPYSIWLPAIVLGTAAKNLFVDQVVLRAASKIRT